MRNTSIQTALETKPAGVSWRAAGRDIAPSTPAVRTLRVAGELRATPRQNGSAALSRCRPRGVNGLTGLRVGEA